MTISRTLYTLRHWFRTEAYKSLRPGPARHQELLRQTSPVMTARYTSIDPAETVAAVNNLPQL